MRFLAYIATISDVKFRSGQPNQNTRIKELSDFGGLGLTLVILSTVAVFDLVKASQARVVAAVSLGVTTAVGLSSDRHCTGHRRDHHR